MDGSCVYNTQGGYACGGSLQRPVGAAGTAEGFRNPVPVPDGTYLASCNNCSTMFNTVTCRSCGKENGKMGGRTSIPIHKCDGDNIANINGVLKCGR